MIRSVKNRLSIIGGSSMVDLRNNSEWGCRRKLAYDFLGYENSDKKPYTIAMQLGHYFEVPLRDWFSDINNVDCREGDFIRHEELPFIGGHPDGLFGYDGIIEIKTANSITFMNMKRKGVYEPYKDQLTLYMGITKRYNAYFVIGNSEDLEYKFVVKFQWDKKRYKDIIDEITDFVCAIYKELPPRCGKRKQGLRGICIKCEFLTLCAPKLHFKTNIFTGE